MFLIDDSVQLSYIFGNLKDWFWIWMLVYSKVKFIWKLNARPTGVKNYVFEFEASRLVSVSCFRRNARWFECSGHRGDIAGTGDASFLATGYQCCPVGALVQTRWPFCVLFSSPMEYVWLKNQQGMKAFTQACWTGNTNAIFSGIPWLFATLLSFV